MVLPRERRLASSRGLQVAAAKSFRVNGRCPIECLFTAPRAEPSTGPLGTVTIAGALPTVRIKQAADPFTEGT